MSNMNIATIATHTIIFVNSMVMLANSFKISCPDPAQWHLVAKGFCKGSLPFYTCLLDDNNNRVIESCEKKLYFQTPGYKLVIRGGYDGKPCDNNSFQPFKFSTDGNNDCVLSKSKCEEEGQEYSKFGTTTTDVSCRCDNTKGYAFVTTPLDLYACYPSFEDCSCYLKTCDDDMGLTGDYECIKTDNLKSKCPPIAEIRKDHTEQNESTYGREEHYVEDMVTVLQRREKMALLVLIILMVMIIVLGVFCTRTTIAKCCAACTSKRYDEKVLASISDRIKRNNIVTIVSDSNSLLTEVTSRVHDLTKYPVVYCSFKLIEVTKIVSSSGKILIVIRDLFEKDPDDKETLYQWNHLFIEITNQVHKDVKILIICKPQVFQTSIFQNCCVLLNTIFDLDKGSNNEQLHSLLKRFGLSKGKTHRSIS